MNGSNQQAPHQPQPPSSISPIPEQPPSTKPWLKWILLIITAVFLSSGGTYLVLTQREQKLQPTTQPSPSPASDLTAEWKTYINTKVGFQMKYPPRYPQPALPSGIGPVIYAKGSEDNTRIIFGEKSTDSIGFQVFPFIGTLDELVNYQQIPSWDGNTSKTLIKQVLVSGKEARWYKATPPTVYPGDEVGAIKIYFIGKNHGFILDAGINYSEDELNQILQTFKFLE